MTTFLCVYDEFSMLNKVSPFILRILPYCVIDYLTTIVVPPYINTNDKNYAESAHGGSCLLSTGCRSTLS